MLKRFKDSADTLPPGKAQAPRSRLRADMFTKIPLSGLQQKVCVVLLLIMCRTQHRRHHVTARGSLKTVAHFPVIKQVLNGNSTTRPTLDIAHKIMIKSITLFFSVSR